MINKDLVEKVRNLKQEGINDSKDILKIIEFWKYLSGFNNHLSEALWVTPTILVQIKDNETNTNLWISVGEGEISYGSGTLDKFNIILEGSTKELSDIFLGIENVINLESLNHLGPGQGPTLGELGILEGFIEEALVPLQQDDFDVYD